MIHVWRDTQQNKCRVWNPQSTSWSWIDGFTDLDALPFIKSGDVDICLYLPTQSVLTLSNELTLAQTKQLGASGQKYLFEELSLSPVEQLRVRHINGSGSAKRHFYALGSSEVEQWQQAAELAGYKLSALVPDFVLLPNPDARVDGQVVLYQPKIDATHSQSGLLARFSEAHGVAVGHISLLPRMLSGVEEIVCLSDDESVVEVANAVTGDVFDSTAANTLISKELHQITDAAGIVITPSSIQPTPIATPIKHPLNFVEIKRTRLASPYLTLAASLFLLAGITQITADALQWYQYEKAATATRAATDEQFTSWFAGESLNPRVDVSSQVKPRLLSDASNQQPQLALMSRISPLIKQSQLTAESLRWNDSNVVIVVKGENRSGIDQLQKGLTEQGVSANLGAVTPSAEGSVIGEINIALNTVAQ